MYPTPTQLRQGFDDDDDVTLSGNIATEQKHIWCLIDLQEPARGYKYNVPENQLIQF